MRQVSGDEILSTLGEFLGLARTLGLSVEHTRYWHHRAQIERLYAALKDGPPVPPSSYLRRGETDLDYMLALTETVVIGDALPFLRTCDQATLRRKLTDVLKGPVLPSKERHGTASNRARNITFELSLGGNLWQAGLRPQLGEHPDLTCMVGDTRLYIQCKRPFSANGVPEAIKDARKQLCNDLRAAPPGPKGVIALDVSRVINDGTLLLTGPDVGHLRASSEKRIREVSQDAWNRLKALYGDRLPSRFTNIGGILFHGGSPAWDRKNRRFTVAQHTVPAALWSAEKRAGMAFERLLSALKKIDV